GAAVACLVARQARDNVDGVSAVGAVHFLQESDIHADTQATEALRVVETCRVEEHLARLSRRADPAPVRPECLDEFGNGSFNQSIPSPSRPGCYGWGGAGRRHRSGRICVLAARMPGGIYSRAGSVRSLSF